MVLVSWGLPNFVKKAVDGVKYAAEKTYDGAKYAAEKTYDGAKYVAEKTYDGAKYVAEKTIVEPVKDVYESTVEVAKDGAKRMITTILRRHQSDNSEDDRPINLPEKNKYWITDLTKTIDTKKKISCLTIPGTHDSGTSSISDTGGGKTQTYNISTQLAMGVRFLDIRLSPNAFTAPGKLFVYHGVAEAELTFDEVIEQCEQFLRKNRGEFILMSVKSEDNGSYNEEIFVDLLENRYHKYFANKITSIPTIEQAQGKIILFRRFDNPKVGIELSIPNDTPFDKAGSDIYVQDKYNCELEQSDKKKSIVKNFLEYTTGEKLYINFVSATGESPYSSETTVMLPNPKEFSKKMNPWLTDQLKSRTRSAGILAVDFADVDVVNAILEVNQSLT